MNHEPDEDPEPDYAAPLRRDPETALTPRTCKALFFALQCRADDAYDDAEEYGSGPLNERCAIFTQYPRITWGCDREWRRRAARAFDDLAEDMVRGTMPRPRCPAEEMALLRAVRWAHDLVQDDPEMFEFESLPPNDADFWWDRILEQLMSDLDIELLFDPRWDGLEDPFTDLSLDMGMMDYRPAAWFDSYPEFPQRDPGRGFRR